MCFSRITFVAGGKTRFESRKRKFNADLIYRPHRSGAKATRTHLATQTQTQTQLMRRIGITSMCPDHHGLRAAQATEAQATEARASMGSSRAKKGSASGGQRCVYH